MFDIQSGTGKIHMWLWEGFFAALGEGTGHFSPGHIPPDVFPPLKTECRTFPPRSVSWWMPSAALSGARRRPRLLLPPVPKHLSGGYVHGEICSTLKVRGAARPTGNSHPYNKAYTNDTVTEMHNTTMHYELRCLAASAKTATFYSRLYKTVQWIGLFNRLYSIIVSRMLRGAAHACLTRQVNRSVSQCTE